MIPQKKLGRDLKNSRKTSIINQSIKNCWYPYLLLKATANCALKIPNSSRPSLLSTKTQFASKHSRKLISAQLAKSNLWKKMKNKSQSKSLMSLKGQTQNHKTFYSVYSRNHLKLTSPNRMNFLPISF